MSMSWQSETAPDPVHISFQGWVLIALRVPPLMALNISCLLLLWLVRVVERPLVGAKRPVSGHIAKTIGRLSLWVIGFQYKTTGKSMKTPGAVVGNHSTWIDIFTLHAANRVTFVSKAEVASWPAIGWLAKATGTVFIERDRAQAQEQTQLIKDRLQAGHKLLFFPEGTSTDGCRILPFKSTLFQPFMSDELRDTLAIQPVTVVYHSPAGEADRYYGWWAAMSFGENLLKILATSKQGQIEVVFHDPLMAKDFKNRKTLAAACEAAVRGGFEARK
ncbi:1-acyl-sn-glycerol-3-phosphate acyltransferase [Epibacterium ulvae]|uniref:lysophospholipid acyltransferase family protein n=1 Tax=Epibacterium ulvae TaxID=1156985 RepID=UPI001BFC95D1|nr:lysophospholipid acyltransferase family protein [Epibacterium ulvae]MBT8154437.1 1-acyl-sn-glycerol-3-phosphate acyltransferase [Epibacterium ulvae]